MRGEELTAEDNQACLKAAAAAADMDDPFAVLTTGFAKEDGWGRDEAVKEQKDVVNVGISVNFLHSSTIKDTTFFVSLSSWESLSGIKGIKGEREREDILAKRRAQDQHAFHSIDASMRSSHDLIENTERKEGWQGS